jgi:hypothetical protein
VRGTESQQFIPGISKTTKRGTAVAIRRNITVEMLIEWENVNDEQCPSDIKDVLG